jgi:hypothetical protein
MSLIRFLLAALHRKIYLNNPSINLHTAKSSNVIDPPLAWLHSIAEFTLTHHSTSFQPHHKMSYIAPRLALPRRIYLNNPSFNLLPAKPSNVIYPPLAWLHSLAIYLNNPSFNLLPAKTSNVINPPLARLHFLAEFTAP